MQKVTILFILIAMLIALVVPVAADAEADEACWGQVTAVYAALGLEGEHSSSFAGEPRDGLYALANDFYEAGAIDEPTLWALGALLNDLLGLDISACE